MLNKRIDTRSRLYYYNKDNVLPKEGLVNLMYIFKAVLRLENWPKSLRLHK